MVNEENLFRDALDIIGMDDEAKYAVIAEGYTSMESLNFVTRDFLKTMCKNLRNNEVTIPHLVEFKLYAMHNWVSTKIRQGIPIIEPEFTEAVCADQATLVRESIEKSDKDDVVPEPKPFTKDSHWTMYDKLLTNYLGSKCGKNLIPLAYVVRKEDDAEPEDSVFQNEFEKVVKTTPHTGAAYEHHNGTTWTIIKALTMQGPAWAYISHLDATRDGRGAIKALRAHYEGDAALSRTKDEAYKTLKNASYSGEKRNWTFEQYVTLHRQAHQTLRKHQEPVPENKKVRDFLDGIDASNNHAITASIAAVKASTDMTNSFDQASNYLANFVSVLKPSRQISDLNTRGRGQGRGRGRGGGRGRGRGGGRGGKLRAKHYTNTEWHALSPDDQDKVKKMRKDAQKQKRKAAALEKQKTKEDKNEDTSEEEELNAGDQFALSRKKKKGS